MPTFADWSFPHENLPAVWRCPPSTSSSTLHIRADRDRCSMTRATLRIETAHIVPANPSDVKWWNDNGMSQYGEHDSTKNTIRFKVGHPSTLRPQALLCNRTEGMILWSRISSVQHRTQQKQFGYITTYHFNLWKRRRWNFC